MLPLPLLLCRSKARLNGVAYLLFKESKRRNERHQQTTTKKCVDRRGQNLRKRAAMFEREETIDERYRLSKSRLGDSFLSGWQANISSSGSNRRSQVARSRKKSRVERVLRTYSARNRVISPETSRNARQHVKSFFSDSAPLPPDAALGLHEPRDL